MHIIHKRKKAFDIWHIKLAYSIMYAIVNEQIDLMTEIENIDKLILNPVRYSYVIEG